MLTKDVTTLIKYGTVILVKIPVRGAENKMKGSCSENSVSPGLPDGCIVIFGLLVSVPFILGGSQLFLKVIDRYPIIVYAGGALLGWIAGTLIVGDPGLTPHIPNLAEMHTPAGIAGAVFVLIVAFAIKGLRKKAN